MTHLFSLLKLKRDVLTVGWVSGGGTLTATALQKQRKVEEPIKLSILIPFESSKSVGMNVYSLADLALIRAFCTKPSVYA